MLTNEPGKRNNSGEAHQADAGQEAPSANVSELDTPDSTSDERCPWDYSIVNRVRRAGGPVDILAIPGYPGQPSNWQLIDL